MEEELDRETKRQRIEEYSNLSSNFEEIFNEDRLALTLGPPPSTIPTPPPSPPQQLSDLHQPFDADLARQEHNSSPTHIRIQSPCNENIDDTKPPYQWATNQHGKIHDLKYLLSKNIKTIEGEVKCKKCNHTCTIEFDLETKFTEIALFILGNKSKMHQRAPYCWRSPKLPTCTQEGCNEPNSLRPVIPTDKQLINWLFLLLGQMLGCCTLEQLKYFCGKMEIHRTGAKDRVLYLTYLNLCKQLDSTGPFDHPMLNGNGRRAVD